MKFSQIGAYMWTPHVILSPSLLPVSPGDARFAVMAPTPPEAPIAVSLPSWRPIPVFRPSVTPPSRPRRLPSSPPAFTLVHAPVPLLLLPAFAMDGV